MQSGRIRIWPTLLWILLFGIGSLFIGGRTKSNLTFYHIQYTYSVWGYSSQSKLVFLSAFRQCDAHEAIHQRKCLFQESGISKEQELQNIFYGLLASKSHHEDHDEINIPGSRSKRIYSRAHEQDETSQGPGARRDFPGPMSKTRLPRAHEQGETSQDL